MAPMAGILFCDYWLVKRKRYDVPALYDPKGIYLYQVRVWLKGTLAAILTCIVWHQLASSRHHVSNHRPSPSGNGV
jgi:cytosine/uracil/thiamine/allantoin permease